MNWAYDLVTGPDWGHYVDDQSDYEYPSPLAALAAARVRMEALGFDPAQTGITIVNELDMDSQYTWSTEAPGVLFAAHSGVTDMELT